MAETIQCTAWDLVGQYSHLVDESHAIQIAGGRVLYYSAAVTQPRAGHGQRVRLQRFDTSGPLRVITRYVNHDQPVVLIPIEETEPCQD